MSVSATLFRAAGKVAVRLPRFRGRTRAFLFLFDALGLRNRHTLVETVLSDPIPYRVRLDLHSWLQRIAFLTGSYEADTVSFLLRLQRSDGSAGYLLDIGANVGLISVPTALALDAAQPRPLGARVVSIEAVPDNVAALRHNIALNAAQGLVTVIDTGLGEREGAVDIQVEGDLAAGEGTGTANILPAGSTLDPNGTYECVRIPIQITTLDALQAAGRLGPGCSVIKIDTDGYDLKVLEGGVRFLAECRPVIFGEFAAHCMRWHGQSIRDVEKLARATHYQVWQRLPDRRHFRFSPQLDPDTFSQDLLLVPAERSAAFAWCCE